jgi:hypothetical protein
MDYKGIEFTLAPTTMPGVWKWQFQIGNEVKNGKTETRISFLAIRRVQLRIDRALRSRAADYSALPRKKASGGSA